MLTQRSHPSSPQQGRYALVSMTRMTEAMRSLRFSTRYNGSMLGLPWSNKAACGPACYMDEGRLVRCNLYVFTEHQCGCAALLVVMFSVRVVNFHCLMGLVLHLFDQYDLSVLACHSMSWLIQLLESKMSSIRMRIL